jgi:tetratricopeptide (TPR) repeat protein
MIPGPGSVATSADGFPTIHQRSLDRLRAACTQESATTRQRRNVTGFARFGRMDQMETDVTPSAAQPKTRRRWYFPWTWRWWVFALLLPLLFTGKLINIGRHFMARRLLHQARRELLVEDLPRAAADFGRSIGWEPDPFHRWEAYFFRGQTREQMQDLRNSLADFDTAIELLSDPGRVHEASADLGSVYRQRAWVYERLGQHREAIADATAALSLIEAGEKPAALNQRAYIRALAGQELEQGLQDIEQAISQVQQNEPAYIDTRGYLKFKLGEYPEALADLQKAIQGADHVRQEFRRNSSRWYDAAGQAGERELSGVLREYDRDLSVMYHHRGEVYEKLKDPIHAEADLHRSLELGFDPAKGVY